MVDNSLDRPLADLAEQVTGRYWGKYRGTVESVEDDERMGRITVMVPSVYGDEVSPSALPAVPFAGPDHAFLVLPKQGDGVWVEFENGDPSHPIWTGCWWARGELPAEAAAETRVLITPAGLKLVLDDDAKEIKILHGTKGEITLSESGITIRFGRNSIKLADDGIKLNEMALKVT
jgi:uncharacterized protein involved in type VI secretion and phage assembly